jgi:hypothetical protein
MTNRTDQGDCDRTHTATSGLSAALGKTPQVAAISVRNVAGFLVTPQ